VIDQLNKVEGNQNKAEAEADNLLQTLLYNKITQQSNTVGLHNNEVALILLHVTLQKNCVLNHSKNLFSPIPEVQAKII
jgi:hypothetical protein